MKALPETGRQRLERNDRARAETETEARPWRLALMVLFGAYLTWHIWLWSQRAERPRVEGLDELLTLTRWLNVGALLWILIMHPVSRAWRGAVGVLRKRRRTKSAPPKHADGPKTSPSATADLLELLVLVIACGGSVGLFLMYYLIGLSSVALGAMLLALPWAPVVYIARRAFPGGRNQLVIAGLLAFFAVGIVHSCANRGFYQWKYSGSGVRFAIPSGESSRVAPAGLQLPIHERLDLPSPKSALR
ncbi:MAG: hypothetical protein ACI8Q9_001401 [Planctomycetota bacterium]|jgi:hypothetical protein